MEPSKIPWNVRLERHIVRVPFSGCWLWTAYVCPDGYARLGAKLAHRVAYATWRGPIPDGYELDHLCRVRCCVNPEHLEPVGHAENVRRGTSVAVLNSAKTHCKKGHEFSPENTINRNNGSRGCRECSRAANRKTYAARPWVTRAAYERRKAKAYERSRND